MVVLCYHSIHPRLPFASASPELFRAQLAWLAEHCDVVRFADVARLARERDRGRAAVAITFDDGYRDNHSYALPLLEEARVPATFFVTVGLVERDAAVTARIARIRGTSEDQVKAMSWGEIGELVAAGHEVGSHTWSHPVLARLATDEVRRELEVSKRVLEDRLGLPVSALAYPFGKLDAHVSPETVRLARQAGYVRAGAVLSRAVRPADPELVLPRFLATRDDVRTLEAKVRGAWDWLGLWQEHAPRRLVRAVSPADWRDLGEPRA
ncbi:MAG TPA: polysaccharide deacetylase family protein [Gaiellaceae bacterium]|nr:polysaccharide deacetylase family protein [Gaiellaceae bacterium]